MRYATYEHLSVRRTGVVSGDAVHPLDGEPLQSLIRLGEFELRRRAEQALAAPGVPLDEIRLPAPIEPPTVRDFVTFEEHVEGVRRSVDDAVRWFGARLRTRRRRDHRQGGPGPHARAGARPHPRLHDLQRLVGPRPAGRRDEGRPGALQGRGFGFDPRPVDRHG